MLEKEKTIQTKLLQIIKIKKQTILGICVIIDVDVKLKLTSVSCSLNITHMTEFEFVEPYDTSPGPQSF